MKTVVQSTKTHKGISVSKVRELQKLYGEMQTLFLAALDKAIQMGEILSDIKEELPHGQFGAWIDNADLPFKTRTAQLYMRLYERKLELKDAGIDTVGEAQKFLSSGGNIDRSNTQSFAHLDTEPDQANTQSFAHLNNESSSFNAGSGTDGINLATIKLTSREQQLVTKIVDMGGDRKSAETGIKIQKWEAKQERERRLEEKKQLEKQKQQEHGPTLKPLPPVPPSVYRRFSRLSKQTGRPIADLLAEAVDTMTKNQRIK